MSSGDVIWLTPLWGLTALLAVVVFGRLLGLHRRLAIDGRLHRHPVVFHPLAGLLPLQNPRQRSQRWAAWVALGGMCVAIAQPVRLGSALPLPPPERDIVLLLDTSVSMQIDDYRQDDQAVTRLDLLRALVRQFATALNGERVGVIVFGDMAHTLVPLTQDMALVRQQTARISVGMAGRQSAIGDALLRAIYEAAKDPQREQTLLVFTDADDQFGATDPIAAAQLAAQAGLAVNMVAIGAAEQVVEQDSRQLLFHPVNLGLLGAIAKAGGGELWRAEDAQAIEQALDRVALASRNEADRPPSYEQTPLYRWVLVIALLPWISIMLIGARQR
ncbi:MAG: VWA domain-containing protein [Gammaproteobacteria bacterium]|nr:VWA domain-containing protein [Gammaproteobacteria bacterium]